MTITFDSTIKLPTKLNKIMIFLLQFLLHLAAEKTVKENMMVLFNHMVYTVITMLLQKINSAQGLTIPYLLCRYVYYSCFMNIFRSLAHLFYMNVYACF